jgi:hypothetical protein
MINLNKLFNPDTLLYINKFPTILPSGEIKWLCMYAEMKNFASFVAHAEVAELVDALRSGRSRCTPVRVRVSSSVQASF